MGMFERAVWARWWDQWGGEWQRVGLNVPLYDPYLARPGRTRNLKDDSPPEPLWRVDAVIGRELSVCLVEVKVVGNMTAIGQLHAYRWLFPLCYHGFGELQVLLVAERIPPAIRAVAEVGGISWSEVGSLDRWELRGGGTSRIRVEEVPLVQRGDAGPLDSLQLFKS